jgi:ring-1,2-phenylacetyl-CoA epoxidase subunit PaaC
VTYHAERSADWIVRLGDGTDESHGKMQAAIDALWMYTGEAFVPDAAALPLVEQGVACDVSTLLPAWRNEIGAVLTEATLEVPGTPSTYKGGGSGVHTEHLGHLLATMQWMQRAYPGAQW